MNGTATAQPATRRRSGPQSYDFRRPNKFSREHVRALQIVNETFARQFANVLASTLRAVSQVRLTSVDQLTYDEYIQSTEAPTYLAIVSMEPLPGAGILHIPLPLAMGAVDRLLGGSGAGTYPNRPLTDIESGLLRGLTQRLLRELSYAFESLVEVDAQLVVQESNPQFAQIAAPTEMVVVASFDMRIGSQTGEASLCLPYSSLQHTLESFVGKAQFGGKADGEQQVAEAQIARRLGQTAVDVSVAFNQITLTSGEIVGLAPGDVVPLGHRVDAPLTMTVAGVPCHAAVPGRKGKRLACYVVDPSNQDT
ncbi:MAG TPA: flagellar motor switch protein FliM [Egibacteraceae bacterium]|nr:flagellar motor switch protein FliM [Egibacteraceae bacterium]